VKTFRVSLLSTLIKFFYRVSYMFALLAHTLTKYSSRRKTLFTFFIRVMFYVYNFFNIFITVKTL